MKFLADKITKLKQGIYLRRHSGKYLEKLNGFAREKLESSLARNSDLLRVMDKSDLEFRVRTVEGGISKLLIVLKNHGD